MDKITVKVNLEAGIAIVRKDDLDDNGLVDYKQALGQDGEWITVPEAGRYPPECILPIVDQTPSKRAEEWESDVIAVVSMEVMHRLAVEQNRKAQG